MSFTGASLDSIERNYGCVAEYNRCMEERCFYEDEHYLEDDELFSSDEDE